MPIFDELMVLDCLLLFMLSASTALFYYLLMNEIEKNDELMDEIERLTTPEEPEVRMQDILADEVVEED